MGISGGALVAAIAAFIASESQEVITDGESNFLKSALGEDLYEDGLMFTQFASFAYAEYASNKAATGTEKTNNKAKIGKNISKTLNGDTNNSNGIGNPVKITGNGSTGRTEARNLAEQMAMHEVMSNPMKSAVDLSQSRKNPIIMKDQRWPAEAGDGYYTYCVKIKNFEFAGSKNFCINQIELDDKIKQIKRMYNSLNGFVDFRDIDSDSFLHFEFDGERVKVNGQLGGSWEEDYFVFAFFVDQTILSRMIEVLSAA